MTINNFLQPIEILNPIYDKNNCGVPSCNLQMKIKCIKSNVFDFVDSMNSMQSCSVSKETIDLTVTGGTLWSNNLFKSANIIY